VPPPPLDPAATTYASPSDVATFREARAAEDALERGREAAIARLPVPAPASGTERFGVTPGSGYREPPSLVRRCDGQTIQLSPLLYAVLEAIDGHRDHAQIAAHVGARVGRPVSSRDIVYLIETKLRPLGLLLAPDGSEPPLQKANPLLALRCKFVVSDPRSTRRITRPFAALFRPSIVALVLAAFVAVTWWVVAEQGLASSLHQAFYEPHLLLLVFALTLVSAGFHEFGHAAACRYGGATPGAMGVGLYLVWPAFYTDVTDSYRLGRGGRLRVDLGGLYFNAVFAVGTFGVWAWTGADALLLLIVAQLLQMSRQLAPLVRFDGYHILADLTGVPDLFGHLGPILRSFLPRRLGGRPHTVLRRWARVVVTAWVLVVVPLLAVLLVTLVMIAPRLFATAWDALGVQWEVLGTNWADRAYADVGVRLLSIVSLALPVLTVSYLLGRVARRTALRLWSMSEGSRPKRAAVLAVGLAALVGLALMWWPQGQYTPIKADERGPVPSLVAPTTEPAAAVTGQAAPRSPTPAPAPRQAAPAPAPVPPTAGGAPTVTRELGLVLVPRTADGTPTGEPVRIVLPNDDGPPTVLEPTEDLDPTDGWPFPWPEPPPVAEGDNRAIVVNTEDGSTIYDVALAFVWVTDGEPVTNRNEAFAYASCHDCTSVAVAFQVVMIIGHHNVVTPIDTAVAANYDCNNCRTHAIATQLVVTLAEEPDELVMAQLGHVWSQLERLEDEIHLLSVEEIYLRLKSTESQLLGVLLAAGVPVEDTEGSAALADDVTDDITDDEVHDDGSSTEDPDVAGPDEDPYASAEAKATPDDEVASDPSEGDGTTGSDPDGATTDAGTSAPVATEPDEVEEEADDEPALEPSPDPDGTEEGDATAP
jgi:putative peptide zinc metalloprotease protein